MFKFFENKKETLEAPVQPQVQPQQTRSIAEDKSAELETMLEVERQASARFRKMIDDMPVSVMTCDLKDFKINYANKASIKALEKLRHVIPYPLSLSSHLISLVSRLIFSIKSLSTSTRYWGIDPISLITESSAWAMKSSTYYLPKFPMLKENIPASC